MMDRLRMMVLKKRMRLRRQKMGKILLLRLWLRKRRRRLPELADVVVGPKGRKKGERMRERKKKRE